MRRRAPEMPVPIERLREMNHDIVHSGRRGELDQQAELRERLRRAGIVLLTCDAGGRITARQSKGQDWLTDLLCGSVLFRSILADAVRAWEKGDPSRMES